MFEFAVGACRYEFVRILVNAPAFSNRERGWIQLPLTQWLNRAQCTVTRRKYEPAEFSVDDPAAGGGVHDDDRLSFPGKMTCLQGEVDGDAEEGPEIIVF